jgi:hypothetical protein
MQTIHDGGRMKRRKFNVLASFMITRELCPTRHFSDLIVDGDPNLIFGLALDHLEAGEVAKGR